MRISRIEIKHFRSIDDLDLELASLTAIAGPNSCGKSGILAALMFSLEPRITKESVRENIDFRRDSPNLQIRVKLTLSDCCKEIAGLAGKPQGSSIEYSFRATRAGNALRSLDGAKMSDEQWAQFAAAICIQYVPPIRDLGADGMQPLHQLLGQAVKRTGLKKVDTEASKAMSRATDKLLADHNVLARSMGVDRLELNTAGVSYEAVMERTSLDVEIGGRTLGLHKMGTGDQSRVIMHLYTRLGENSPGETIYLLEEPDNHLHPTHIRSVGTELLALSCNSQVLLTTHSPVLLNHLGYDRIVALVKDDNGYTRRRSINVAARSDKAIRALLAKYGMRATEPLLSRRVVIVEGLSDVTLLTRAYVRIHGCTPDQDGFAVLPVEGKANALEMAALMHDLGVDYVVVVDEDACWSHQPPMVRSDASVPENSAALGSVQDLLTVLDPQSKRAKGLRTGLARVKAELEDGPPEVEALDGSCLDGFLAHQNRIGASDRAALRRMLKHGRTDSLADLLIRHNVWVWRPDIESSLINSDAVAGCVEARMIEDGHAAGPINGSGSQAEAIRGFLHNRANEPSVLESAVEAMFDADLVTGHSALKKCIGKVFGT